MPAYTVDVKRDAETSAILTCQACMSRASIGIVTPQGPTTPQEGGSPPSYKSVICVCAVGGRSSLFRKARK